MNLRLTFRDLPPSDSLRAYVEKRTEKLARHADREPSLHVTLANPHRHHQHGGAFRVSIEMTLAGSEIVVTPRDGVSGHADLYAAIDDAFDAAERQLRDHGKVRRSSQRTHASD